MSIDIPKLKEELKVDEGFRECVYKCSAGKLTIGYGHNVEDNPIPEAFADQLLGYDIAGALAECERFDWFFDLDDVRKRVIINMVFNLGFNGESKFKNMISAIEDKEYVIAAGEMSNSRWYRQVGARADRLCDLMAGSAPAQ